ncbi:hypothetical protein BDFB_013217 [Asbolus verrucosus]|uniref:7tm 7 domain containing protein n=1 Tax=Asbolus verrucosus TaxID=1661398 RepID=A0A482VQ95_ASBVE|nr:hypothetical protein BDFB_013217 [Asbolus verrucosus]
MFTIIYFVTDFINEFFVTAVVLTVVFNSSFQRQKDWLNLINIFQYLDKIFNNVGKEEKNICRNVYVQLLVHFSVYLSYTIFILYIWIYKIGVMKCKMYWLNEISYGYDNIVHFLIFNIAIVSKCRYENLNKLVNIDVVVGYRTKKESIHFIRKTGNNVFMKKLTISNVVFSLCTMTSIAIVILSCDYVRSESDRLIFLCYKLQEQFPYDSRERMELFNLANQITAKITAAKFFKVNKSAFLEYLEQLQRT